MEATHISDEGVLDKLANVLLLDRSGDWSEPDVLYPFALEELLCRYAGEGGPAIVHLWRHPRAFVMGLRDSRLPNAGEAKAWLEAKGYNVAVRNSGGAAVPLDLDVLNISLIYPKQSKREIDFRDDFATMAGLIAAAVQEAGGSSVAAGEIAGAYCPGDFDLSINGLKFCGIAQRRQLNAYVVQAFVVCGGSGGERAGLVRNFYDRAAADGKADARAAHPQVTEQSTASLAELLGERFGGTEPFAEAVKAVVRTRQNTLAVAEAAARLKLPQPEEIREMADSMRRRYGLSEKSL